MSYFLNSSDVSIVYTHYFLRADVVSIVFNTLYSWSFILVSYNNEKVYECSVEASDVLVVKFKK